MKSSFSSNTHENQNPQIMWILWCAITAGLFIYAIVAYIISLESPADQNPETLTTLMAVLSVVAAGETGFLFLFPSLYAKNPNGNFMTLMIIRLAVAESIGIFGLVGRLMGVSWVVFAFFLVWSLVLMISLMPTKSAIANFDRLKNRKFG